MSVVIADFSLQEMYLIAADVFTNIITKIEINGTKTYSNIA